MDKENGYAHVEKIRELFVYESLEEISVKENQSNHVAEVTGVNQRISNSKMRFLIYASLLGLPYMYLKKAMKYLYNCIKKQNLNQK